MSNAYGKKLLGLAVLGALIGFLSAEMNLPPELIVAVGLAFCFCSFMWAMPRGRKPLAPVLTVTSPPLPSVVQTKPHWVTEQLQQSTLQKNTATPQKPAPTLAQTPAQKSVPKLQKSRAVPMRTEDQEPARWEFIPQEKNGLVNSDLNHLFELVSRLDEPAGRRLIVSQFKSDARLIEPLEKVLSSGRPLTEAILKNIAPATDLIPFGWIRPDQPRDELFRYLDTTYSQVIVFAPNAQRQEWVTSFMPPSRPPFEEHVQRA